MQMLTEPNQHATTVKKLGHYRHQCRLLKKNSENKLKRTKIILETKTVMPIPLTPTATSTELTTTTETVTEPKEC